MRTQRLLLCLGFAALVVVFVHELVSHFYQRGPRSVYRKWAKLMKVHVIKNHLIQESEDRDIEVRMKFQQSQVMEYCGSSTSKMLLQRWLDQPSLKASVEKHLFTNNSSTVLMCYVGSKELYHIYRPALSHTIEYEKIAFRFTLVRHPLERLLFTYIDHLKAPLYSSSNRFPNSLKQEIFEKFRPVVYQHWISTGGSYNISITFSEFINYYIESFKELLDSSLQPYTHMCAPCQLRYHFYGRYRRLEAELSEVVKYGKSHDEILWQDSESVPSPNVTDLLLGYYGRLTATERTRLYDALRQELLFYYHLYPGERFSHVTILGIHDDLYKAKK